MREHLAFIEMNFYGVDLEANVQSLSFNFIHYNFSDTSGAKVMIGGFC